eukprot:CAMPEP_0174303266 /NCGR_PEP_ID=MMETSP0809-20121228/60082_1 /TAXON_ID=73025 ORGANISM="Eutreptiella gymnastica-like, Strain CCMP1594" /NCGR_SAMPLE_ID=MMETSP0809 /ASSEMBLY_ACC=CAM_ASM_000658 /LENGTH=45 /DNA_ID= /DNA_START= /DNA_END= /DNA_ORIENTATION=
MKLSNAKGGAKPWPEKSMDKRQGTASGAEAAAKCSSPREDKKAQQ